MAVISAPFTDTDPCRAIAIANFVATRVPSRGPPYRWETICDEQHRSDGHPSLVTRVGQAELCRHVCVWAPRGLPCYLSDTSSCLFVLRHQVSVVQAYTGLWALVCYREMRRANTSRSCAHREPFQEGQRRNTPVDAHLTKTSVRFCESQCTCISLTPFSTFSTSQRNIALADASTPRHAFRTRP